MSENAGDTSNNALVVISSEKTNTPIGLSKSAASVVGDKPRIICNELIFNPNKSKSMEKLDELSSLELEIAKLHHADDTNMETLLSSSSSHVELGSARVKIISGTQESDLSNGQHTSNILRCNESNLEVKLDVITSGETALEHEDLIAVLKGLDGTGDESHNDTSEVSILEEGVTIEGEGEYQIMEVVDEDSNTAADEVPKHDGNVATQTLNKTKTFGSTSLTAQEERALALEQMEGLKNKQRRRKQEINPIKQVDPALDLISSLEADWSENDEDAVMEKMKCEPKTNLQYKTIKSAAASSSHSNIDIKSKSPLITSVVVIPSSSTSTTIATGKTNVPGNNDIVSSTEEKQMSPHDGIIETKMEEDTQVVQSQSGFRRTRIIKRKIIWDPDAPETTFSYAKLVKTNNTKSKTKTDSIPSTTITKGSTTITPIKKETPISSTATTKKTSRPTTPKAKKSPVELNSEKINNVKSDNNSLIKTDVNTEDEKLNTKPIPEEDTNKLEPASDVKVTTTPPKKRSQTPVTNGPGSGAAHKKKKNSELERLMGDEGAVNMLNSLEKFEAALGSSETKPSRPMMRSRAATICEKLPRKQTPPPVRTSPPTGSNQQNSKNKRNPKSRASATWDYVYKKKKQDFDDSLIIRRRSNSSYSSTASQNRLSLDGQPQSANPNETSSKSNDSKTLPASTSENDSPKSPPSSSSHNKSSGSSKNNSSLPAGKTFEFAKPENKKSQKRTKSPAATLPTDMKKAAPVANRRNVRSPANSNEDKDNAKSSTKSPTTSNTKEKKESTTSTNVVSDVVVKKSSKVAQILFSTNKAKLNNTFTIQMLNKLVDILGKLASDPDCHVVVMGTSDAHFCQGVDVTDLTTIAAEKRKTYATNLATAVKNYLKTLATYPKPLIAGVMGNLMNLGVVQLAMFDIVIASDKSTFETPYVKMGQIPEGYCIWHNMNKIRGSFKTKLFWLCEKVQSTEAALAGLVNKLTSSNKVNDDAFNTAKRIASLSSESYSAMKTTVINSHLDVIENSLDDEFDSIIKQWTTSECLDNIKKYIEQGHF